MPRRYFNWKLASVCVIGLVVLSITAFGLRKWQRSRRADSGLVLGNKAYNEHNWQEAARNLGRYLAIVQDDVPALLKYADAQLNIRPLKQNNVRHAIATYRTVLRIDKGNSEAASMLVEIYLQMKMPGEAELIATRALQIDKSPKLRRMLAVALINQRKFKEAADELKAIIKEHPEQILAYEILGRLIEQRGENFSQPPQFWFNEAVKNNPSTALAYIIRAAYHLRHVDKSKTITDLEQAENLDLSDSIVRLRLAREFINVNSLDKAEEHLAAIQATDPTNQALWRIWAQFALKQKSKTKMLKIAETGLKELSHQPWAFMPIAAELFIRCNELDRASDCISKLQQKDIVPATTAFLEALIADQKGQGYEAVKYWQRAMQLGNKSPQIQLMLASVLSRLGDTQSAIRQLRTLVSETPSFADGRLALARLLAKNGNWAQTAEQARIARQISPNSLDAALLYIQAQIQLLVENQTDKVSPQYQRLEDRLAKLEKATNNIIEVQLLQFQLAIRRSQFDKAEQLLRKLKNDHPSQIKVAMADIELLTVMDKTNEAISKLKNIIETFPQFIEPVRRLAILLARQDKPEECEAVIKNALSKIEQPIARRKLSFLLTNLYGRWEQEEKLYELLTSLEDKLPDDVPVKRRLLRCQQIAKKPEQAQQLVNNIKALEGQNSWQWRYEQARLWFGTDSSKDRYPQIISLLKENLLANSHDQASRILLAHSYERTGQLQLAISTYTEALNRSPRNLSIIIPTIAALYKTSQYDRADQILRRAANEKLFHPELNKFQLQSHLRHGQLNSAGDILENLLANDPNNPSICLSLALLRIRQNHFTEADKLLGKLKAAEPNSLIVTVAQINSNIRQGKSSEAILLCNQTINKLNNASAYILRARTFVSLGQSERAEKDFEHATVIEPNNTKTWTAKSNFYRSIGQLDKAITSIQKAMSLQPQALAIQKQAVSLFSSSANRDIVNEGKNILNKALTANPDDIELQLFKARFLLVEGTAPAIEQATSILRGIAEDSPKTAQAWALLGEITLRQAQPLKAMDIALRGLVHRPKNKSLLLLKARSEASSSPALAIPTLKALLELDPNDADIAIHLANTYIAAGDYEKSITLLRKQLASCGESKRLKCNIALAAALYKNGNKDEAEKEFDLLFQSAPDDPTPLLAQTQLLRNDKLFSRLNQMVLHWCRNHPKDTDTPVTIAGELATEQDSQAKKTAEDILRMVLKNDSNCTKAMGALAMLLQITGRPAESAPLYQQFLELEPDNTVAINNLAWILCEEQGRYQQALELAHRGLKIAPNYVDLIDTRGSIYHKLGQYDKAITDFSRCLRLYPDGTPAVVASYLHLGRALAALGQKSEAIGNLKRSLDLNKKTETLSPSDTIEAQRLIDELTGAEGV